MLPAWVLAFHMKRWITFFAILIVTFVVRVYRIVTCDCASRKMKYERYTHNSRHPHLIIWLTPLKKSRFATGLPTNQVRSTHLPTQPSARFQKYKLKMAGLCIHPLLECACYKQVYTRRTISLARQWRVSKRICTALGTQRLFMDFVRLPQ
jgi:hypothetical protein